MGKSLELMLIRLIYDYSIKEQYVDDEFIKQLIDMVVSKEQLQEYVKKHSIESYCKDSKKKIAGYSVIEKKIIVYRDSMYRIIESRKEEQDLLSKIEQIFYKNILIVQIILHELEHARQNKIAFEEETLEGRLCYFDGMNFVALNSLDSALDYLDYEERVNNYYRYYKNNYEHSPIERLAEINSYQKLLNALRKIEEFIPNLVNLEDANKLEQMLLGYDFRANIIISSKIRPSPTIQYLQGLGVDMNSFDWYDEIPQKCFELSRKYYSLNDRLKYGLPVNDFEFGECLKILKNTIKYR